MNRILILLFILWCQFAGCSNSSDEPQYPEVNPSTPSEGKIYKVGDVLDYTGLEKVWGDDFASGTMVDETSWTYEQGYVRNKENQYYTARRTENCRIEDGMLVIEGRKEDSLFQEEAQYTSASIITNKKKSWKYGRFEIRAKIPAGKGSWPAFWMKGDSQNTGSSWPNCGEIDVMEYAGKDPNIMIHNAIYGGSDGKAVHSTKKYSYGSSLADDFHIYSLHWDEKQLVFAIDNKVTHTVDLTLIPSGQNPFNQKFSVLLNLALGSDTASTLGGPLDPSILPIRYYVDYVHVYQEK